VVVGERSKISFAMRYSAIGSSALDGKYREMFLKQAEGYLKA
jgi:hypothetical protein